MTRQTRTAIVLGVAIVAAAASSYGVYRALTSIPVREVEVATSHAVVAARQMPMGTRLTKDDVKLVPWPSKTPLIKGFTDVSAVADRGLIVGVAENEPLVETKLAPREAGAGLPPAIPPGMRAMSVKVNEVVGVAGFVVPGTRVDVLAIIKQPLARQTSSISESTARIVVSNAEVLTAGTKYDQDKAREDGEPIQSRVVTLLVSPEDAQRVALSQSEGQLMLALRNPLDMATAEVQPVGTSGLLGMIPIATVGTLAPAPAAARRAPVARRAPKPAAPVVAVQAPPPPKPYTVEVIRAAKRTEEVVR